MGPGIPPKLCDVVIYCVIHGIKMKAVVALINYCVHIVYGTMETDPFMGSTCHISMQFTTERFKEANFGPEEKITETLK